MKILLILLSSLLLVSAQVKADSFGIEGGTNFNNYRTSNVSQQVIVQPVTYFIGGVYADIDLIGDALSFRPDLLFSTSSPNYLTLPLMVSYKFNFGVVRPYIFAGPEFGYNFNPGAFLGNYNIALDGGVGVDFVVSTDISIGINWRYCLGLINQFNSTAQAAYSNGINQNNASSMTSDSYLLLTAAYHW